MYTVGEAARYLRLPPTTLRSWVVGRPYPVKTGQRFFRPVVAPPQPGMISFINLVEAHVLNAMRREHHIALDKVREAIRYLRREFGSEHPLADERLETDGLDLFVQKYGQLINISRHGQSAMRELLRQHLRRITWDKAGLPMQLYPFTRREAGEQPKTVVIDPRVSFGRPVLAGTGIPTAVIAERYKAGESVEQLARDYGRSRLDIEEAIRCELQLEAA